MFRHSCAAVALIFASLTAHADDGKGNRYHVRINADRSTAEVEASVWVEGGELAFFGVSPTPELKNGQASFVEQIAVTDASGAAVALTDKGEGEYQVKSDGRLALRYRVRLAHDRHAWPAGTEEVAYHTDEGLMATGYVLFLVPGVRMHGPTRISFELPAGWRAHTPWKRTEGTHSFIADTRRELCNNALFFGTARAETFQAGGIELTLVMGQRYWPQRALFRELIEKQAATYLAMFGKAPLADRYLIIINQGDSGDGGAFSGSFSQFLRGYGERATRPIWGRVVAHELLHFWNGLSMEPEDGRQEWFKEGVTDYLTVTTMARNGLVDGAYLRQFLENLARGQMVARMGLGLTGTVQEAAKDKHKNWLLVYGGGSVAALAMDIELQRATGGKRDLPGLMRAMYAQFGAAGKRYTLDDIIRTGRAYGGVELGPVLAKLVQSDAMPDQRATFAALGLQLEQYPLLESFLLVNPQADAEARKRFHSIFGPVSLP